MPVVVVVVVAVLAGAALLLRVHHRGAARNPRRRAGTRGGGGGRRRRHRPATAAIRRRDDYDDEEEMEEEEEDARRRGGDGWFSMSLSSPSSNAPRRPSSASSFLRARILHDAFFKRERELYYLIDAYYCALKCSMVTLSRFHGWDTTCAFIRSKGRGLGSGIFDSDEPLVTFGDGVVLI